MSTGYLSRLESGARQPTDRAVGYLAGRLGLDVADFEEPVTGSLAHALTLASSTGSADAIGALRAALAAEGHESAVLRWQALWLLARAARLQGDHAAERADLDRLVALGDEVGSAELRVRGLTRLARCLRSLGEIARPGRGRRRPPARPGRGPGRGGPGRRAAGAGVGAGGGRAGAGGAGARRRTGRAGRRPHRRRGPRPCGRPPPIQVRRRPHRGAGLPGCGPGAFQQPGGPGAVAQAAAGRGPAAPADPCPDPRGPRPAPPRPRPPSPSSARPPCART